MHDDARAVGISWWHRALVASRAAAGRRWRSAPRWGDAPPLTPRHAGALGLGTNLIPACGRGAARGSAWKAMPMAAEPAASSPGSPAVMAGSPSSAVRRRATYGLVFGEPPPPGPPRRRTEAPPAQRRTPVGTEPTSAGRPHGTYAKAVVERCRCDRCTVARRDYDRTRRRAIARPDEIWLPYVSAVPARDHLVALAAAGVGLKTVARLSGVSHGSLSKIVYGEPGRGRRPSRRVRPETLARILAVRACAVRGGQRVDATPTWRLLDELVAAGHSRRFLARALGSQAEQPSLQVGRTKVRASTARSVEELHARLRGRPARPTRTR